MSKYLLVAIDINSDNTTRFKNEEDFDDYDTAYDRMMQMYHDAVANGDPNSIQETDYTKYNAIVRFANGARFTIEIMEER